MLWPHPLLLQTVQRLLASAVADPSVTVRRTILEALSQTSALESHLAQAECLRSLFVVLNDESSIVRSLTIQLAGHISPTNPAYVMPALRRHLMQLLSDMDHSPDSRQREGAPAAWPSSFCLASLFVGPAAGWTEVLMATYPIPLPHFLPLLLPSPLLLQRVRGCWVC